MSIKDIFKATSVTFKKNISLLLPIALASGILLFAAFILMSLLATNGFGLILVLVLSFPMFVGIKYVVKKCVLETDPKFKDYYFGFNNFLVSSRVQINSIVPFLGFFLAGFFIVTFGISAIIVFYAMATNPELLSAFGAGNIDKALEILSNIKYMDVISTITTFLSVVVGIISGFVFGLRRLYTCFITLDAPFSLVICNDMNKAFAKNNKKKYNLLNLIFALLFSAVFILSVSVGSLFNESMYELLPISIGSFIFFILGSIIFVYFITAQFHSYNRYLRSNVLERFENIKKKVNTENSK